MREPVQNGHMAEKTLGWMNCKELPDELPPKPCPACGYKYGISWKADEVPADVVEWLTNLPE